MFPIKPQTARRFPSLSRLQPMTPALLPQEPPTDWTNHKVIIQLLSLESIDALRCLPTHEYICIRKMELIYADRRSGLQVKKESII